MAENATVEREKAHAKPEAKAAEASLAREYTDADLVTVLHGWGRVASNDRHYVDRVLFLGGVATNVPYSIARHWLNGTRPDGKPTEGKVKVQLLHNEATEADYIRATGIQPMEAAKLAALLTGADLDAIFAALGSEKALQISDGLRSRIAGKPAK